MQGCAASRGDPAEGQRDEQGALPKSGTTSMTREKALCPHGRWKTSKPCFEGVCHYTILVHSWEKSILPLLQTISLRPVHLLPSKNTNHQGNPNSCCCCLGRGNSLFKARHPDTKHTFSLQMVSRDGTFHVGSCSFWVSPTHCSRIYIV